MGDVQFDLEWILNRWYSKRIVHLASSSNESRMNTVQSFSSKFILLQIRIAS